MKKTIASFLALCVFAAFAIGCAYESEAQKEFKQESNNIIQTFNRDKLDKEYEAPGVHNVVVDEELAVQIGDVVLRNFYNRVDFEQTELYVGYLKDEHVYFVSRRQKEKMAGGGFGVAIREDDGAILKIWAGE